MCMNTFMNMLLFCTLICILGITASEVLPNVADVCASFQFMVLHHLVKRVQRALLFCELKKLLPDDQRILVCRLVTVVFTSVMTLCITRLLCKYDAVVSYCVTAMVLFSCCLCFEIFELLNNCIWRLILRTDNVHIVIRSVQYSVDCHATN